MFGIAGNRERFMHDRTVLVVDDDPFILDEVSEILTDHGYSVRSAANGKEALDVLRSSRPPCIVVSDLMMPVMDGATLLHEMGADSALAAVPVVVISAQPPWSQLPAKAFLPKPFSAKALLTVVRKFCDH